MASNTSPFTLDVGTLLSLGLAFSLMPSAQLLASLALPKTVSRQYKFLFLWHAYDFLTHFMLEGSFLYHCFFSYAEVGFSSDYPHPASLSAAVPVLYGQTDRKYGPAYSNAPMARLWQEYAKADKRWGQADLNVISLEILTVGLAGPAAVYVCYLISQITNATNEIQIGTLKARLWFLATLLATGELYGGFMTFAPEWLSGNTQLAGEDPVYLWLYLVFFNILWVFVPLWVLYQGFKEISAAFQTGTKAKSK